MSEMKIFLGEYKIIDGEHEHYKQLMVKVNSVKEANEIFLSQEHEPEPQESVDEIGWWDNGDGTTASRFRGCHEIPEEEALILDKHGSAQFFPQDTDINNH